MVNIKDSFLVPGSNIPIDIEHWVARICSQRSNDDKQLLLAACILACEAHQDQLRTSGDPYLAHVLTVADILADLGLDTNTLVASILHDVTDKKMLRRIEREFGTVVTKLIQNTAKMHAIEEFGQDSFGHHWEDKQKERFRKMLLAMAEDPRVVLIKLADRLDNMRTLRYVEDENLRHKIAHETLELYAPLANRLGIWQIKWELEDLSLRCLEPETYKQLAKLLDERRVDRERYLQKVVADLTQSLTEVGIKAEVSGRAKHIYSIWHKMNRKQTDFNRIFDVLAVRVLVHTVTQCYTVLGIVHRKWQPIPHEFDDYIAAPKHNHYQSLHTAVYGPENRVFEVQIRTEEMHHHAELGIAAHWRYKECSEEDKYFDNKINWLRQIIQNKEDDSSDLLDKFKSEIYEERVYVVSPKGKVIDLPKGSTPLDFAYYIHTQLGHQCRGAKVNGRLVALTYELQSGQQVEILTSKECRPSLDWLNENLHYLHTARAKSSVRTWFSKYVSLPSNIQNGKRLLDAEFKRLNITNISVEQLARKMKLNNADALLADFGCGEITTAQINKVLQEMCFDKTESKPITPINTQDDNNLAVRVSGVHGLLVNMAGCCRPAPYDPIIGYITKTRGVMVHRQDCPNALRWQNEDSERLINVEWSNSNEVQVYPVDIQIFAFDRRGLLNDVCQIIYFEGINILATNTITNKNKENEVKMQFTLEITSLDQLSKALAKIDNLPNVMEVTRLK